MKQIAAEFYESSLTRLFRELKVPSICRELLRAFLTASRHEVLFHASKRDLAMLMFDTSEPWANLKKKTGYRLERLSEWQLSHRVELVRTLKSGHRETNDKDTTIYVPTRYELILLASPAMAFADGNADSFSIAIDEAIATGKKGMEVAEPPRTHIRKQIERDKSTFKTTLRRMFDQAAATEEIDPFDYCRNAIIAAEEELHRLNEAWKVRQGRKNRLERHKALIEKNSGNNEEQPTI